MKQIGLPFSESRSESRVQEMYQLLQNLQKLVPQPSSASADQPRADNSEEEAEEEERTVVNKNEGDSKTFVALALEESSEAGTTLEDLMGHQTPKNNKSTAVEDTDGGGSSVDLLNTTPPCRDVGPSSSAVNTVVKTTPVSSSKLNEVSTLQTTPMRQLFFLHDFIISPS